MSAQTLKVKTIGVYGSTEESFFNSLVKANVDTFCDVRLRRGVRGAKYAYVNSNRLQSKLKQIGIRYIHLKQLAPTLEMRNAQKRQDRILNVAKSARTDLGEEFKKQYNEKVLGPLNCEAFRKMVRPESKVICLFCVEKFPEACHRSLVSSFLSNECDFEVEHLHNV